MRDDRPLDGSWLPDDTPSTRPVRIRLDRRTRLRLGAVAAASGLLLLLVVRCTTGVDQTLPDTPRPSRVPSLTVAPLLPSTPPVRRTPGPAGPGVTAVVYVAGEPTALVDEPALPFVFRRPASWSCGTLTSTGTTQRLRCVPPQSTDLFDVDVTAVQFHVRRCGATPCPAERYTVDWVDAPVTPRQAAPTVWVAETSTPHGYRLLVGHPFVVDGVHWHLGVSGRSGPGVGEPVQKIVNDAVSQTP